MNASAAPPSPEKSPAPTGARLTPKPLTPPAATEDLDLEEDVAPNLGGEDQMQDA
jgi:hypothetical protein